MDFRKINFYGNEHTYIHTYNNNKYPNHQKYSIHQIKHNNCMSKFSAADTFIKTAAVPPVNFTGGCIADRVFESKFPRRFFKKLMRESIPDAYTGLVMIPQEKIDNLKLTGVLNKKSAISIPCLKRFKTQLYPIEKEILTILENLSKKYPYMNIQQLIQLRYKNAEVKLINQQAVILNKINMKIRNLPQQEYKNLRKVIQESFDKIFEKNPTIENRFKRKDFINNLRRIPVSDKKIQTKILEIAEQLPQSCNNLNAFIVKYSQNFKITKSGTIAPRTSEDIGIRLLFPSIGTDDHIHPQTLFKKEKMEKSKKSHNWQPPLRVTVLTTRKINEIKSDSPIDDFIDSSGYDIITNVQRHIQHLIFISEKWAKNGRLQDAVDLADYITILKDEFHRRSKKIKIDISEFEEKIPALKDKLAIFQEKQLEKTNSKKK